MPKSDSFELRMQVRDLSVPGTILREVDGLLRVDPPEVTMSAMPRRNRPRLPFAWLLAPGSWIVQRRGSLSPGLSTRARSAHS